jgi:hypothetical protein
MTDKATIDKNLYKPYFCITLSYKEENMVVISEAARNQLENYFADNEKAPIRVYLSQGG